MPNKLQSPGAFLAIMLEKYKLNPFKLSKDIQLSQSAVRLITIGKTKITTPVALRLAKYFNTNPEFWLAMQMKWDIAEASTDKKLVKIIKSISRVTKASAGGGEKKSAPAKEPRLPKKPAAKKKKATAKKKAATKKAPKKAAAKKPRLARKPAVKKRVTARKPRLVKKPKAGKKAVTRKRATAKKPVRAKKKTATGKRGRPAKK